MISDMGHLSWVFSEDDFTWGRGVGKVLGRGTNNCKEHLVYLGKVTHLERNGEAWVL